MSRLGPTGLTQLLTDIKTWITTKLGNYVTTDTTQTVTGKKYFTNSTTQVNSVNTFTGSTLFIDTSASAPRGSFPESAYRVGRIYIGDGTSYNGSWFIIDPTIDTNRAYYRMVTTNPDNTDSTRFTIEWNGTLEGARRRRNISMGDLIPQTASTYNLGESGNAWQDAYINKIHGISDYTNLKTNSFNVNTTLTHGGSGRRVILAMGAITLTVPAPEEGSWFLIKAVNGLVTLNLASNVTVTGITAGVFSGPIYLQPNESILLCYYSSTTYNATISTIRRSGVVGRTGNVPSENPKHWFKIAENYVTATYRDPFICLRVFESTTGNTIGTLCAHCRINNTVGVVDTSNCYLQWQDAGVGFNLSKYALTTNETSGTGVTISLWCQLTGGYSSLKFEVVSECGQSDQLGNPEWVLTRRRQADGDLAELLDTDFTKIVYSTLTTLKNDTTGKASNVTGTVAIANGGTGATTRLNAVKNLTNESVGTPTHFLAITTNWGKAGYTTVAQAKTVLGITGDMGSHSDSEYVHKTGNETISGDKTFGNGTLIVDNGTGNNVHGEIKLNGTRPVYINADNSEDGLFANTACGMSILLNDASKSIHIGGITTGANGRKIIKTSEKVPYLTLGTQEVGTQILVPENDTADSTFSITSTLKYASGASAKSFTVKFKQGDDGSSGVFPVANNKTDLGLSGNRWKNVYATNYYYGADAVEFSSKFVTTDTAQTITGAKTFANSKVIVGRNTDVGSAIQLINSDVVGDSANGSSGFEVYGSSISDDNKIGGLTVGEYSNNGGAYATIEVNRTVSGVKTTTAIRSLIRSDGSKEFSPSTDNDIKLGHSSFRWSAIYGNTYYYGSNNVEFSTKFVTTDTAQTITGVKTFNSDTLVANQGNAYRIANSAGTGYGVLQRMDGTYWYMLVTANNDPLGTWTSARPITIRLSDGYCTINGKANEANKVQATIAADATTALVQATVASNDCFRIAAGGAANAGWAEIATGDDANEPIYVRQYKGSFTTLQRTATLLDGSGNTSFPGTVTATGFSGPLTGDVTGTATKATSDANGREITTGYMWRGSYERIVGTSEEHKDLNTYQDAGFYNVKTALVDNCPSGIGVDAVLLVYPWDHGNYPTQEITEAAASSNARRWVRKCNNGTWSDWKRIAFTTDDISGTAAKATGNANGNEITDTVIKGLSISGKTITYTKIDGNTGTLTTQDTVYTHPTTSGNKHIPSGGSSGQFLGWDSDGTAKWVNNPNTNTDTLMTQNVSTTDSTYPILLCATANATSNQGAKTGIFGSGVKVNPKTSVVSAKGFSGIPTGNTYVSAVKDGGALVNSQATSWGAIWRAPTKDYQVAGATWSNNNNNVYICYSVTNANAEAGTNTMAKSLIWAADTGTLTTTTFSGALSGNASSATEFSANKDVTLTGDVTGTASSKAGWSVATTLANSGVTAGTYGPSADVTGSNNATILVPEITVDAKGRVTAVTNRTYTSVNTDSDKKVYQYYKSDDNVYRLLFSNNAGNTATSNVGAAYSGLNNSLYVNPSTGALYATKLYSNGVEVLTAHQSLSNYVTLNTAQEITNTKTFKDANTVVKRTDIEAGNTLPSADKLARNIFQDKNGKELGSIFYYKNTSGNTGLCLRAGDWFSESEGVYSLNASGTNRRAELVLYTNSSGDCCIQPNGLFSAHLKPLNSSICLAEYGKPFGVAYVNQVRFTNATLQVDVDIAATEEHSIGFFGKNNGPLSYITFQKRPSFKDRVAIRVQTSSSAYKSYDFDATCFYPESSNSVDIGSTTNIFKNIYCNNYYKGTTAFGDIVTHNASEFLTNHQSLANYVTLDGAQTISGAKTFTADTYAPTPSGLDNSTKIATTAFVYNTAAKHLSAATNIYVAKVATGNGSGSNTSNYMSLTDLRTYLATVHMHSAASSMNGSYNLQILFKAGDSFGDATFDATKMPGVRNLILNTSTGTNSTVNNYSTNSPTFGNINVTGDIVVTMRNLNCTGRISSQHGAYVSIDTYMGISSLMASNYGYLNVTKNMVINVCDAHVDYLFLAMNNGILAMWPGATVTINFRQQCYYARALFYASSNGTAWIGYSSFKLTGTEPMAVWGGSGTLTGTSETAAATVEKAVTLASGQTFTLTTNATAKVKFTVDNTAANPTLNIGGTGAKPIYWNNAPVQATMLMKNITYDVKYNGSQFVIQNAVKRLTNNDFGVFRSSGNYNQTYNSGSWNFTGWALYYGTGIENSNWRGSHIGNIQQNVSTVNNTFPVLICGTANATANTLIAPYFAKGVKINPSTNVVSASGFDGPLTWSGTAFSYIAGNSLYYYSGQPAIANCFEGSSNDFTKFSYPAGGTSVSSSNANIQTLRLDWGNTYWHDLFMSPNNNYLWHRNVVNSDARGWRRIVEENVTGLTDQSWNINIAGTSANVTGTVDIANGGTGATTRLNAVKALTNESVGTPTHFLAITTNYAKAGYTTVAQAKTVLGITGDIVSHNASEFLTSHQSLDNYVTTNTDQDIEGDKNFKGLLTTIPNDTIWPVTASTTDDITYLGANAIHVEQKSSGKLTDLSNGAWSVAELGVGCFFFRINNGADIRYKNFAQNTVNRIPVVSNANRFINDVTPNENNAYSLGTSSLRWSSCYSNAYYLGTTAFGDIVTHNASEFLTSHQSLSSCVKNVVTNNQTIKSTAITRGTAPSSAQTFGIGFSDNNNKYVGNIYGQYATDMSTYVGLYAYKGSTTTNGDNASVRVGYDASGNAYTYAPTPATADNSTQIATTAFVKAQGYLTSHQSLANYVTTNTNQTISGVKSFSDNISTKKIISNVAQLQINARSSADSVAIIAGANASDGSGIWLYGKDNATGSDCRIQIYNTTKSRYERVDLVGSQFLPNPSGELDCGGTSNKWKSVYATNYYYGNDNVEFSTKFVTTDTDQSISGIKSHSKHISILGDYIGNESSTNGRSCLYLKANRDTDGKSGLYVTKFRQNVAQGSMGSSDVVFLSHDILENETRTNAGFVESYSNWANNVPGGMSVYSTIATRNLGTSAKPWTNAYITNLNLNGAAFDPTSIDGIGTTRLLAYFSEDPSDPSLAAGETKSGTSLYTVYWRLESTASVSGNLYTDFQAPLVVNKAYAATGTWKLLHSMSQVVTSKAMIGVWVRIA